MTAREHLKKLREEKPASPDIAPEPFHREIVERQMNAFFDGTMAGDWTLPQLPERLLPYQWLYRSANRDPEMPQEMREAIQECVEDTASVLLGERKGRLWEETAEANIAELERLSKAWIVTPATFSGEETDPYTGETVSEGWDK